MFTIAYRDLQWRLRRIAVSILGASLVLALALLMSGLSAAFENEAGRTVALARAQSWVVDAGGSGPFLGPTPLTSATVTSLISQAGSTHAAPFIFGRQSIHKAGGASIAEHEHVNLVGSQVGGLGSPWVKTGRELSGSGQAVVDSSLGVKVGETILLGRARFAVVGTVSGARLLAGVADVYVSISDAQKLIFGGQNLATAVISDRSITPVANTRVLKNPEAVRDGLLPVLNAQKTIALVRSLLWLVAALIVGSVMYLGVIERTKDIAVLKGMGISNRSLATSLAIQAGALGLVASAFAAILGTVLAPMFPLAAEVPKTAYIALPLVAVTLGLMGCLLAARRAIQIQPALAFGA